MMRYTSTFNVGVCVHCRVRLLLMQSELVCLTEVYPDAIPCLLEAKEITRKHYLDYLGACADLHLAHVQPGKEQGSLFPPLCTTTICRGA